ncbi:hypothetical protein [Rhizobium beringeri]|uniref:hypothetical protein n=1 Tax=Rhizobium beringeri TaxID=3019934 RepID=UPI002DDCD0BE|nr:hypothetical protein [Rhizobium beringeri]
MTHMEFLQHAGAIRTAIISAIEVYMTKNGLPFSTQSFVDQKDTDLEQVGKEALFLWRRDRARGWEPRRRQDPDARL